MKSLAFLLLIALPVASYSALIFGGADTAKACDDSLKAGAVSDKVPDPDDCSSYYVCSKWFQSKMKCKAGEHFSATEKKCLDICSAGCDTSTCPTTTSEPASTEATAASAASAAESGTTEAVEATEAAEQTTEAVQETTSAADIDKATTESIEETTAFWQSLVKKFNPPAPTAPSAAA